MRDLWRLQSAQYCLIFPVQDCAYKFKVVFSVVVGCIGCLYWIGLLIVLRFYYSMDSWLLRLPFAVLIFFVCWRWVVSPPFIGERGGVTTTLIIQKAATTDAIVCFRSFPV
jgi:hypothetical protein